jgi:hypothetical protein
MIDKGLRNEIAQCKLMISDAESLHFYRSITRFIKYGSKCNFRCSGGSYKLLRGYPPSPFLGNYHPSKWRGVLFFILFVV